MPNLLNANAKLRKERNDLPSLLAVWFLVLHCLRLSSLLLVSSSSPCLWVPLVLVLAEDEGLGVTTLNLSLFLFAFGYLFFPCIFVSMKIFTVEKMKENFPCSPLFSIFFSPFSFSFLFFVFTSYCLPLSPFASPPIRSAEEAYI
jgi:hypothetical protein